MIKIDTLTVNLIMSLLSFYNKSSSFAIHFKHRVKKLRQIQIRKILCCTVPLSFSGAYLVPYFILLLLIGIPLFFLELAVGQRIRRGSIGVWNYMYPQLGGIGVSSLMVSARTISLTISTSHWSHLIVLCNRAVKWEGHLILEIGRAHV